VDSIVGCIGKAGKIADAGPDDMGAISAQYVKKIEFPFVEAVIFLPVTFQGGYQNENGPNQQQNFYPLIITDGQGHQECAKQRVEKVLGDGYVPGFLHVVRIAYFEQAIEPP